MPTGRLPAFILVSIPIGTFALARAAGVPIWQSLLLFATVAVALGVAVGLIIREDMNSR
jgi:hypothetical protein